MTPARFAYSDELHQTALAQHTALVQAICEGDQDSAANIASRHFHLTTSKAWRSVLRQAGEDATATAPVNV